MSQSNNIMKPIERKSPSIFAGSLKVSMLIASLAISGCASYQTSKYTVGSIPKDYRSNHPIVVSQSEVHEDIVIASTSRKMSPRHRGTVTNFVGRFKTSGSRQLRVYIPSGSANASAARHVSADMVNYMQKLGLSASKIAIEHYDASNHGDAATIRFVYGSLTAKVHGECGKWNEDLTDTSENVNYENFGCATQNNLAEMIANPEDLLGPRGESEIDAERRDNVINRWRGSGN